MSAFRAAILAVALACVARSLAEYPDKPIKLIVPTNAGGEVDGMAHTFAKAFYDLKLLPQNLVVINKPGGGGTIATREVKDATPDGYTLCLWHPGIVTSKAMGVADFDHTDFEIIGTTGYTETGMGFKTGGRITSAEQAIQFAKENPNELIVSTNVGLPVHFFPLMFAKGAEIDLKFVQSGGGAKRLASLMGGHSDLSFFSTMAFKENESSGLRPLFLFSENRSPDFPDTPTAKELGIDLVVTETRIWLAPKGTPPERIELIRNAIKSALADPGIAADFRRLGIEPEFGEPEKLLAFLDDMKERVIPLVPEAKKLDPMDLYALPKISLVVLILLIIAISVRGRLRKKRNEKPKDEFQETGYKLEPRLALYVPLFAAVYTLIITYHWLSFQFATWIFVIALGSALGRLNKQVFITSLIIGAVVGFGGQYLFTQIFNVDLPQTSKLFVFGS